MECDVCDELRSSISMPENTVLYSTPRSSKLSLLFEYPDQNFLSHVCVEHHTFHRY